MLFDKDVVSAAVRLRPCLLRAVPEERDDSQVEAVRIDGLANLATAEERRFAELFK